MIKKETNDILTGEEIDISEPYIIDNTKADAIPTWIDNENLLFWYRNRKEKNKSSR